MSWNIRCFNFFTKIVSNLVPGSGGGTVSWTNPWGEHKIDNIEDREDGAQGSSAGNQNCTLSSYEEMGDGKYTAREHELADYIF
jgi:hypothetical protein